MVRREPAGRRSRLVALQIDSCRTRQNINVAWFGPDDLSSTGFHYHQRVAGSVLDVAESCSPLAPCQSMRPDQHGVGRVTASVLVFWPILAWTRKGPVLHLGQGKIGRIIPRQYSVIAIEDRPLIDEWKDCDSPRNRYVTTSRWRERTICFVVVD